MDDPSKTPPQDPDATASKPPAATNPKGSAGATVEDTITLKKEDYQNLISQRDRANNLSSESDEYVQNLAKKESIGDFLKENAEKYPDVTTDDLLVATSPEELEKLAISRQSRVDEIVQKKLLDVQVSNAPVLSPEERAEKIRQLKANPSSGSFQEMVNIRSQS